MLTPFDPAFDLGIQITLPGKLKTVADEGKKRLEGCLEPVPLGRNIGASLSE